MSAIEVGTMDAGSMLQAMLMKMVELQDNMKEMQNEMWSGLNKMQRSLMESIEEHHKKTEEMQNMMK